jgi:hypothetical protein
MAMTCVARAFLPARHSGGVARPLECSRIRHGTRGPAARQVEDSTSRPSRSADCGVLADASRQYRLETIPTAPTIHLTKESDYVAHVVSNAERVVEPTRWTGHRRRRSIAVEDVGRESGRESDWRCRMSRSIGSSQGRTGDLRCRMARSPANTVITNPQIGFPSTPHRPVALHPAGKGLEERRTVRAALALEAPRLWQPEPGRSSVPAALFLAPA